MKLLAVCKFVVKAKLVNKKQKHMWAIRFCLTAMLVVLAAWVWFGAMRGGSAKVCLHPRQLDCVLRKYR